LGQPNWLAAWIVALIPITWAIAILNKTKKIIPYLLSVLFFVVLLFTGSRSGLLGFAAADGIFWLYVLAKFKKKFIKPFVICNLAFVILCLIFGTEVTPGIYRLITHSSNQQINQSAPSGTALETGGTESGTIRQIVWKGALQVWLHYPVFGTGVETFAYSYYLYRPAEHNLTSEWDFIYNKAHNEFLNMAANSGTFGLLSYLVLIGFTIYIFIKNRKDLLAISLFSGYMGLLVTNFFGFSVVPTELEFFLFPAIAVSLAISEKPSVVSKTKNKTVQKILIFITLIATGYLLITIVNYWRADYLYAQGRSYNSIKRPDIATKYLTQAIGLEPAEPLYREELASSYVSLALTLNQQKDTNDANQFASAATSEIEKAESLSPANVILKRTEYGVFMNLAGLNSDYLVNARDTLIAAVALAPTDAKLHYYLGLTYARIGQVDLSLKTLAETIALKSDYQDARDAYAIILKAEKSAK
jgi:tetratricopeptide (TPR) repeat protein